MTARAWVTHFDHRYAARGLTMLQSLRRHDPDAALAVVALDDEVVAPLRRHAPWALVVRREELERRDPRLTALREAKHASYAALKPHGIAAALAALEARAPVDLLLFADADLLFYAPPGPALVGLDGASVGVSPQRFNHVTSVMRWSGAYNAGLVAWRTDEVGRRCLRDWGEDCLDWCGPEPQPDGRWMNQGYLDRWPSRYPGVVELTHPGLNLAPWNLETHTLEVEGGGALVDGQPLVAFHFSGLTRDPALGWVARTAGPAPRNGGRAVRHLVRPYVALLDELAARLSADHGFSGLGRTEPLAIDGFCVVVDPPRQVVAPGQSAPAPPAEAVRAASAQVEAPVEAAILLESAEDRPFVAATLAALGAAVERVLLVGDPAWSEGLAAQGAALERLPTLDGAAWLRERRGRDLLLVAGAAALGPETLPALRRAARGWRVGAASAHSAGGRVLRAAWAEAGHDGRATGEAQALARAHALADPGPEGLAAAEPACALFVAPALAELDPPPPAPATALADLLSLALAARGWRRVAAPGAVAFTRPGWRPDQGALGPGLQAALRVDLRARGLGEAGRGAARLPGFDWLALDLTGTAPGPAAEALVRGVAARLIGQVALFVVTDDPPAWAPRLPAGVQLVDGWSLVPTAWFDAALGLGACVTRGHAVEAARGARSWSLLLGAGDVEALDPRPDGGDVERRARLELALALADRLLARTSAAREGLAHRPELLERLSPVVGHDVDAVVAELEAGRAAPARRRPDLPLDPEALLGPSDLRPVPTPPHPVTAWVARRLAWSPTLSAAGKRALDRVRGLRPGP